MPTKPLLFLPLLAAFSLSAVAAEEKELPKPNYEKINGLIQAMAQEALAAVKEETNNFFSSFSFDVNALKTDIEKGNVEVNASAGLGETLWAEESTIKLDLSLQAADDDGALPDSEDPLAGGLPADLKYKGVLKFNGGFQTDSLALIRYVANEIIEDSASDFNDPFEKAAMEAMRVISRAESLNTVYHSLALIKSLAAEAARNDPSEDTEEVLKHLKAVSTTVTPEGAIEDLIEVEGIAISYNNPEPIGDDFFQITVEGAGLTLSKSDFFLNLELGLVDNAGASAMVRQEAMRFVWAIDLLTKTPAEIVDLREEALEEGNRLAEEMIKLEESGDFGPEVMAKAMSLQKQMLGWNTLLELIEDTFGEADSDYTHAKMTERIEEGRDEIREHGVDALNGIYEWLSKESIIEQKKGSIADYEEYVKEWAQKAQEAQVEAEDLMDQGDRAEANGDLEAAEKLRAESAEKAEDAKRYFQQAERYQEIIKELKEELKELDPNSADELKPAA